jgi:murein DD-endopeptidase MepM/ murein hydrolase activator NlpD
VIVAIALTAVLRTPSIHAEERRPATYAVRPGDTLSEIADRFHISTADLMEANGIDDPRGLQEGQELVIPPPGGSSGPAGETPARPGKSKSRPEAAWMRRAKQLAERLGLGSRNVANKLLRGDIERSWIAATGDGRPPTTLRFPVAGGTAGRGWGSGPGNYHLAFDIPGKIGARVSAAAPGIVAYAGDELAGYGKVVMIIHRGGLVTVYAHNSELKTVAGERVKAGTRIALLGSSGISRGPHVHFEVIYQGKLCDPVPLVRPVPRTGSGKLVLKQRDLETWPRRGGPPKGLNCATRRRHPAYVGHPYGWRPPCWPNCPWDGTAGDSEQEDVDLPEETPGPDPAEGTPDAPAPPEQ